MAISNTYSPTGLQFYKDPRNPFSDYEYAPWEREAAERKQQEELRYYAEKLGISHKLIKEPTPPMPVTVNKEPEPPAKPKINKKLLLIS